MSRSAQQHLWSVWHAVGLKAADGLLSETLMSVSYEHVSQLWHALECQSV